MKNSVGQIITFYSFKGGVGRSMALANIATLLAKWGYRVLILDWDLEAPGLDHYFNKKYIKKSGDITSNEGILDFLVSVSENKWHGNKINKIRYHIDKYHLDLITSGKRDNRYLTKLHTLNWENLRGNGIYDHINKLRNEWIGKYDFVLVDSRTGVTDIGDICTVLLPDILLLLFVSNQQNIDGIKQVISRVESGHGKLPVNRGKLLFIPIPCRLELYTEYKHTLIWINKFADIFKNQYYDWIPKDVEPIEILNKIFVPYVAHWSFGESLPVLEGESELYNPTTLGNSYSRIANLIANDFDWNSVLNISDEQKNQKHEITKINSALKEKNIIITKRQRRTRIISVLLAILLMSIIIFLLLIKRKIPQESIEPTVEVLPNDTLLLSSEINTFNKLVLGRNSHLIIHDSLGNVDLNVKFFEIIGKSQILARGANGKNGLDGQNGINGNACQNGQNGSQGSPGDNGNNGKILNLIVQNIKMTINDTFYIDVSGGNGGKGGSGGHGGNGGQSSCSGQCQNGDGGIGGDGGRGGNAGLAGKAYLSLPRSNQGTIVLIDSTGLPGAGGYAGLGGRPGLFISCAFFKTGRINMDRGKQGQSGNLGKKGDIIKSH